MRNSRSLAFRTGFGPRLAALVAGAALAFPVAPLVAQTVTEVQVEKARPQKTKYETLRFLKENKDFVRARLDLLRQNLKERGVPADEVDPRFLAYRRILQEALAAGDSVNAAESARERLELLDSVVALESLESQLDQMDSLLAGQRDRLEILQADFTGHQRTSLLIVLSGQPRAIAMTELAVTMEDGTTTRVALSQAEMASLERGGVLEIFHGYVEPREQVLELALQGSAWPGGSVGYAQLDPKLDRLTILRLDAKSLTAAGGASSLRASTWLLEDDTDGGAGWNAAP